MYSVIARTRQQALTVQSNNATFAVVAAGPGGLVLMGLARAPAGAVAAAAVRLGVTRCKGNSDL